MSFTMQRLLNIGLLVLQTLGVALGVGGWLYLYSMLAQRLWRGYPLFRDNTNLLLMLGIILLGIILVLIWYQLRQQWWFYFKRAWWLLTAGAKNQLNLATNNKWKHVRTPDDLQAMDPSEFEAFTDYVFVRLGYTTENVRDVKDGGVDVLVVNPRGHRAVVQCKRYKDTVGEPTVRDLYGTMIHEGGVYAYLAVSGRISNAAHIWAKDKPIGLLDGQKLIDLSRAIPGVRPYNEL
ncbi:MAG: restriction endonuclease [Chloroflexota bacterium]